MLVWLKNLAAVNVNHVHATIPSDNTYLAYLERLTYHFHNIDIVSTNSKHKFSSFYRHILHLFLFFHTYFLFIGGTSTITQ